PSVAGLPEQAQQAADSGLTGALAVAEGIGGGPGEALAQAARQAFVDGLSTAAILGAIAVAGAAAAAWFLLPRGDEVPAGVVPGQAQEEGASGDLVDEGVLTPAPVVD
ncbi:MAG TPA: hypothetical protein VHK88_15840, partial [Aquihabitans sp.]|nr:hypothetical protein [Aquihabitans sp.]